MPALWLKLPIALAAIQGAAQTERIDEDLVVEWHKKTLEVESRPVRLPNGDEAMVETLVARFSGGVVATFGVTKVIAESLELHFDETDPYGVAFGAVRIEDPEAKASVMGVEFHWKTHRGFANGLTVHSGPLMVRARRLEIDGDKWKIFDATVDPCADRAGLYQVHVKDVEISAGQFALAHKVSLHAFGRKIVTIPRHESSLGPASKGLRFPSISYRSSTRIGISWSSDIELGRNTLFSGSLASFHHKRPVSSFNVVQRLPSSAARVVLLEPRSELAEPFDFGFFENVKVGTPINERLYVGTPRASLSVGTSTTQRADSGSVHDRVSKPWEIVGEWSGRGSGFGFLGQARFHRVGSPENGSETRKMGSLSLLMPDWRISGSLYTFSRFDIREYFNQDSKFGWMRGQLGLVYEPNEALRLSAAYSAATEHGQKRFLFDAIEPMRELCLRVDFDSGPTRFSLLSKYDADLRKWFDHEFSIRLVAGCLEPYISYRSFTQEFGFGVTLRAIDVLSKLQGTLGSRGDSNRPIKQPRR